MRKMSERYDEPRRPFDLEERSEPEEMPFTKPEPDLDRPPWEEAPPPTYECTAAYAAEDAVDDALLEEEGEEPVAAVLPEPEPEVEEQFAREPEPVLDAEPALQADLEPEPELDPDHAPADIDIPDGYRTLEGEARGERRSVAVVVSRFNGEITNQLLSRALGELESLGVVRQTVTVMPVPGAFELPLAAMALAKTRRYACVIALGCVIRGETRHFDFVASEAASGLQLAAIETGTPVAFGVLTCDTREQAEARLDRARDAVRGALEMADVFSKLRAAAGG
jgi:6,7-dimethyl-8-ribityllumazine synthase